MTDLEKTLSNLEKSLEYKRRDSIWNHFLTFTERNSNYSGYVEKNGFTIWKYSSWHGAFYLTIVGRVVEKEGHKKIILSTKLNKFAKFLLFVLFLFIAFPVLDSAINYKQAYDGSHYFWEIKWNEIFSAIISAIVFSSVMFPVFYYVHRFDRRKKLKALQERFIIYSNSTNQDYS